MCKKQEMILLRDYTHQISKIHIHYFNECSVDQVLTALLKH